MHTTVPPDAEAAVAVLDASPVPLGFTRVVRKVFGPGEAFSAADRTYFADLMAAHGIACRTAEFDAPRNSFRDMVQGMLPLLGPVDRPFELAILAAVTPDCQPGYPLCYLQEALPGTGLAFAVADQGRAAPFTALALLARRSRVDGPKHTLVTILDQKALLHGEPVPDRLRARSDSAVMLVLDAATPSGASITTGGPETISARDLPSRLDAGLRDAARDGRPVTAICGAGLCDGTPAVPPGVEILAAPIGLPGTGVWTVLADRLTGWRASGRRVVIADYDEELGVFSSCTVDVPASGATEGAPQ